MYRTTLSICAAWLLVFAAGFGLRAQETAGEWYPPIEITPVLDVRTSNGMGMILALPRNEFFGLTLTPQFSSPVSLCPRGMTVSVSSGDMETTAVGWRVEGRLVELRQDEATVDLKWTRRVDRPDLTPAGSFASQERLTLREGDSHMLDLIRTTESASECQNFGLTYQLRLDGPGSLSDAAIAYDLWLVQQDADGDLVTDRYRVAAKQGEKVDYFFRPIAYTADGRRQGPSAASIIMNVAGTVRGRVRSDGNIDLTVDGTRAFSDVPRSAATSSGGRTMLTVGDGETVEVDTDLPLRAGLGNIGDMNQIFGKHRTAVRITAKRLW